MIQALNRATNINLTPRQTFYRSVSNSGIVRSERASPLFYYLSFDVAPMYMDDYVIVQQEVTNSSYGLDEIRTVIPHGHTFARGDWGSTPLVSGMATGNTVNVDGLPPSGTLRALDFVQFGGTKVYQLASDASVNSSGEATVTLNTPLVAPVADNTPVVVGANVSFNMIMLSTPEVTTVPGLNGNPLWQFSTFDMREVL